MLNKVDKSIVINALVVKLVDTKDLKTVSNVYSSEVITPE